MANAQSIKRRVHSAKNIAKITSAMQLVSASKMRFAQYSALSSRPYSQALMKSLKTVAKYVSVGSHPFLSVHPEGKDLLIVLSGNKGLCGSLNTNLFKETISWSKQHPEAEYIAIGQKAAHFLKLYGFNILAEFTDWPEKVTLADVIPLLDMVKMAYLQKRIKSIDVLYTDFINTLKQETRTLRLLPFEEISLKSLEGEYKEMDESSNNDRKEQVSPEYLLEPNKNALLDFLLNYYLEVSFYHLVLEAAASEHSARMVAMKNASDNAKDLVGALQLEFNKSRQAMITNELLDISTAMKSLSA